MVKRKSTFRDVAEMIGALILAFLFYQALAVAFGTPVPIVSVASDSMIPRLHKGDLVIAIKPENIKVGDIIIYEANCPALPHEDIIHRIVEINNGTYITKGDNNPIRDPCPVSPDEVKGKVLFAIPLLGWPRLGLNYLLCI